MIPDRLPWRLRARPSATLHEIQVRSEERTCCCDATEPCDRTSRGKLKRNSSTTKDTKFHEGRPGLASAGEIPGKKFLLNRWRVGARFILLEELDLSLGIPPPPSSIGIIDLRENVRENLLPQRLRGKILVTKELADSWLAAPTAFALVIVCFLNCRRKVRCHIEAMVVVEIQRHNALSAHRNGLLGRCSERVKIPTLSRQRMAGQGWGTLIGGQVYNSSHSRNAHRSSPLQSPRN